MGAWGKEHDVGDNIIMAGDGHALFSKELGFDVDLTDHGMGVRCQRFSMIVKDGVVAELNVEAPGDFKLSSADHMLGQL